MTLQLSDNSNLPSNVTGETSSIPNSKSKLSRKPSSKKKQAVSGTNQPLFTQNDPKNDESPCSDVYIPPHRRHELNEHPKSTFNRSVSLNYSSEKITNNKTLKGKRHSASKGKVRSVQHNDVTSDKNSCGTSIKHGDTSGVPKQDILDDVIPVVFVVECNDLPHSNSSNESIEPLHKKKDRSSSKKNSGRKSNLSVEKKIQRQETFEGGFEKLDLECDEIIVDQLDNSGKKGQKPDKSFEPKFSDGNQNDLTKTQICSSLASNPVTDPRPSSGSKSWIGNGRGRGRGNSNSSSPNLNANQRNFKIGPVQNHSQDSLSTEVTEPQYNPRVSRSTSHTLPTAKNSPFNVKQSFLSPKGDKFTQSSLSANNTPLQSIQPHQKEKQQDLVVKQKKFVEKFCQYETPFVDSHCHLDLTLWERHRWNKSYELFRKTKCNESYPSNYKGCVAVFAHPKYYESKRMIIFF